jgi:hypothetical protein
MRSPPTGAVIVEIKIGGLTGCLIPPEYQPPLLVHPDRTIALKFAFQFLEMIARWHSQVSIIARIRNQLKLAEKSVFQIRRNVSASNIFEKELSEPAIPEIRNHRKT